MVNTPCGTHISGTDLSRLWPVKDWSDQVHAYRKEYVLYHDILPVVFNNLFDLL